MAKRLEVDIDGRRLSLSNLDKVFYPETGFTKGQLIDYYTRVAPVLLGHLRGRPLTLKRYPDGVTGPYFYEKQCPRHRPDWVKTAPIWSRHNSRTIDYSSPTTCRRSCGSPTSPTSSCTPRSRSPSTSPRRRSWPSTSIPGRRPTIVECAEVALRLREAFEHLGLEAFPKTSGSKGMQVYVPLNTPATYAQTKPFAHAIAQVLERRAPRSGGVGHEEDACARARCSSTGARTTSTRRRSTSTRCAPASGRRSRRRCAGRRSRRAARAAIPEELAFTSDARARPRRRARRPVPPGDRARAGAARFFPPRPEHSSRATTQEFVRSLDKRLRRCERVAPE